MALLERDDGRRAALGARALVGRGSRCDVRLEGERASGEHAVLTWRDGAWRVRDLGSRNGTRVDGKPVAPAHPMLLTAGAIIELGDAVERWTLVDAGPPDAVAVDADGTCTTGTDGLLALPDAEDPRVSVFQAAGGRWLAEVDGAPRYIEDGETLEGWTIHLPAGVADPVASTALSASRPVAQALRLHFAVSHDEEFVQIGAHRGAWQATLTPRTFHYLLLTLARQRQDDADADLSPAEQGWIHVDDLCRMLDTDPPRLNVDVYRARRQLAAAGVADAGSIVERRATSRQIRLGIAEFTIQRL